MKKNHIIIIVVIVIIIAAIIYFGQKTKTKSVNGANQYEAIIQERIAKIRANEEWMVTISEKAAERGVSEAQQLRKDAIWWEKNKTGKLPADYTE